MSSQTRLASVLEDAALTLDERYDSYRADVAGSLTQIIRAQTETSSDAARLREIDKIIEALGAQLRSHSTGS